VIRTPFAAAASCVAAALLTGTLAGCSLLGGSSTDATTAAPTAAALGGTSSVAVRPSSASPTATAPTNAPVPPVVPGYLLTAASSTVQGKFQMVASQFSGVYSGLTVRTVTKGGQQTGTVVLLGLHPELVGNTQVEGRLVPGMVKGMSGQGAKVATQEIGGLDVAVAVTKTASIVAWYRGGTVVLVLANGGDSAPSVTFSTAYIGVK
jgi:hypothetical protein